MMLLGWWRRKGQAARFDFYVRSSFYAGFAVVPLVAAGLGPALGREAWFVLPLLFGHAILCLFLIRAGLANYLGDGPRPDRLTAALGGLTGLGALAAALRYPQDPAAGLVAILIGAYLAALVTAVRPAIALAAGLCGWAASLTVVSPAGSVSYFLVLLSVGLAGRTSLWMLGLVWELDRSRHVQASLAVAEERLRFARDLHDVVGRTLSVVALKSELAAQLARRGRESAIDEMLEVRRVAEESLAEMRAVVGGYRAADLPAELAGARSLLASAGIAGRMIGEVTGLPAAVQGTLGWAVREGTTNVLRHSDAWSCTITLRADEARVSLVMENDGVRPVAVPGPEVQLGSGLVGLAERVAALTGSVTAERRDPGRFRLTVEVPAAVPVLTGSELS